MDKIKIGILGYGNLGRGAELSIQQQPDMELVAIFTRRDPEDIEPTTKKVKVVHIDEVEAYQDKIDVMILCGGSAHDLPEQTPHFTKMFNTVDSFDTHANIPEHFAKVDQVAKEHKTVSIISVGWDPGLFSINRVMAEAILPKGETYTFWGKGLSQGHSDAVRRVEGVKDGVQYTIPSEKAIEAVRSGTNPHLTTSDKHERICYVVAKEGAYKSKIEADIKTMPNYFDEYETTVHFITEEELKKDHSAMPHGGFVIRSGQTGDGSNNQIYEFSLALDSNPEFTSSVLVAYARAAYRLHKDGMTGAQTIYDIAPRYISPLSNETLRKKYL